MSKDSLETRLLVDGRPYRESSSHFRTVTRMAGSGSLTGSMVLNLTAGSHTVQLQWLKTGSGVASWWSQPEFLDGFVTSRSLVVVQERFPMLRHQALTSSDTTVDPRMEWRDITDGVEEVSLAASCSESVILCWCFLNAFEVSRVCASTSHTVNNLLLTVNVTHCADVRVSCCRSSCTLRRTSESRTS